MLGFSLSLLCFGFAADSEKNSRRVEELAKMAIEFYGSVGFSINTPKTMVMGTDPIRINQWTIQPLTSFRYLETYIDPSYNSRYNAGKVDYKLHLISIVALSPGTKMRLIRESVLKINT